jgi:hypothetical protein
MGRRKFLLLCAATLLSASSPAMAKDRRPDLADEVAGDWRGDVVSDSQGAGRPGVDLTITLIGHNRVQIGSDYDRLPVTIIPLEKAMSSIVNRRGDSPFAFNLRTGQLDVSFHNEVSWSGRKRQ